MAQYSQSPESLQPSKSAGPAEVAHFFSLKTSPSPSFFEDNAKISAHSMLHFQASTSLRSPVVAVRGAHIIEGCVKTLGSLITMEMVRTCCESPGGSF